MIFLWQEARKSQNASRIRSYELGYVEYQRVSNNFPYVKFIRTTVNSLKLYC